MKLDSGITNLGGTWKPDIFLMETRNPIPWSLDNPPKGIWDLVANGNRIQWPGGLFLTTLGKPSNLEYTSTRLINH